MMETLKALADPTRVRLLALLCHGEFTVQDLTAMLGMGQSRISRHLKILVDAGILAVKRQGTWGYYRLAEENSLFHDLWPALERRAEALPERGSDGAGLARVIESRRRRSREFFDRHAPQWDRLSREVLPVPDYFPTLVSTIPSCERLLEIGVGTGALLPYLRLRAKQVIGVDHSPAMLEEARTRIASATLSDVDLRLGEMSHLPLPDRDAEVAVLNMVLHHAAQPAQVLGEVARVLTPGGTLVVADLVRHEKEWALERMADQWLGFEPEELAAWLAGAGFGPPAFQVVEGEGTDLNVFIVTAAKATRPNVRRIHS